jgi:hypothetical protein
VRIHATLRAYFRGGGAQSLHKQAETPRFSPTHSQQTLSPQFTHSTSRPPKSSARPPHRSHRSRFALPAIVSPFREHHRDGEVSRLDKFVRAIDCFNAIRFAFHRLACANISTAVRVERLVNPPRWLTIAVARPAVELVDITRALARH